MDKEPPDTKLVILCIIFILICLGIVLAQKSLRGDSVASERYSRAFLRGKTTPDISIDITIGNLIECESGGNPKALGKAGEIGILQFMPATWEAFNEARGTNLNIYNPSHQIDMTRWALENDLGFHWTCYGKNSVPKMSEI